MTASEIVSIALRDNGDVAVLAFQFDQTIDKPGEKRPVRRQQRGAPPDGASPLPRGEEVTISTASSPFSRRTTWSNSRRRTNPEYKKDSAMAEFLSPSGRRRKSRSIAPDDIFGTHTTRCDRGGHRQRLPISLTDASVVPTFHTQCVDEDLALGRCPV